MKRLATFHQAKVLAWQLPERGLERVERRLRRRRGRLDAAALMQWAAVRSVLWSRGHRVPPVGLRPMTSSEDPPFDGDVA